MIEAYCPSRLSQQGCPSGRVRTIACRWERTRPEMPRRGIDTVGVDCLGRQAGLSASSRSCAETCWFPAVDFGYIGDGFDHSHDAGSTHWSSRCRSRGRSVAAVCEEDPGTRLRGCNVPMLARMNRAEEFVRWWLGKCSWWSDTSRGRIDAVTLLVDRLTTVSKVGISHFQSRRQRAPQGTETCGGTTAQRIWRPSAGPTR